MGERTRIAFRDLIAGLIALMFAFSAIVLIGVVVFTRVDGRFVLVALAFGLLAMYFLNKVGTGPLITKERRD